MSENGYPRLLPTKKVKRVKRGAHTQTAPHVLCEWRTMAEQIIFIIVSVLTLIAAWFVVTDRNLFHAALALMASFLGVAGLYVLLEAGFLAAAQLLVYIGAISILVIFAIMMTRRLMQTTETAFNSQWQMGIVTALLLFAVLFFVIVQFWPMDPAAAAGRPDVAPDLLAASVDQLGVALVSADQYVLPFEVASVLLLAALIGSIAVAWPEEVVTSEGTPALEATMGTAVAAVDEETPSSSEEEVAREEAASEEVATETGGAAGEEPEESVDEVSEEVSEQASAEASVEEEE